MKLPMDSLKSYESIKKTDLQTATSDTSAVLSSSVTTGVIAALMMVGLFPRMFIKNSGDYHYALKDFGERFNERVDEIQKQLHKSIEKWENINDQPDHYSISNNTMRP